MYDEYIIFVFVVPVPKDRTIESIISVPDSVLHFVDKKDLENDLVFRDISRETRGPPPSRSNGGFHQDEICII